jgi:xanthine dehydrogenase YagR molybdenum-binding subunit
MPDVIGQPIDRVDGRFKVSGRATYTAEFNIPNVAHGVLHMSTIAKGRITGMDISAASRVPGVLAIMNHQSPDKFRRLAGDPMSAPPSPVARRLQLFQDDRVYYANQPIAMAIAETLEAAEEAAALIKVDYAAEKPSITYEQGMPVSYIPQKIGGAGDPAQTNRGNVDQALGSAQVLVTARYETPFQTHNPMEPHATIAVWEGDDRLTLYDTTQGLFGDRDRVANLLGLKPENVRVISLFLGGGFGSKGPTWSHVLLCAMAARGVGRPVKVVLKRPQMFGPVGSRSATRQDIACAANHDGTLTAQRNHTVTHTSSFDEFTESASLPTRMLYSVPNNATQQRLVRSDIGTPSYMRAPGEAPGTYALEVAMDELAYALKMDPLELRLKNYAEKDENQNRPWSTKHLRECYTRGAERFGWSKRPAGVAQTRDGNWLVGSGMATSVYPSRRSPCSARARANADGSMLVEAGTQDLGTGTYTVMTQISAQTLGVDVSRVTFRLGDTRYPETPVSGGSQTAASAGTAVLLACQALRKKMSQVAAADSRSPVYGAAEDDIVFDGGRISSKSQPSRAESIDAMVKRTGLPYIEAEAHAGEPPEEKQYAMDAFGAQFAEVRVDADLGMVRVSRMVGAFGAGRILNAKLARSQFIGGMVWGISFALYEKSVYDERFARIVNNNLAEYHIPTNLDVGAIDVLWVDEFDDKVDPVGVKGIGEIGITGSSAAVANAIYHATGKRVRNLPITPDALL